jgi:hypothetical protein
MKEPIARARAALTAAGIIDEASLTPLLAAMVMAGADVLLKADGERKSRRWTVGWSVRREGLAFRMDSNTLDDALLLVGADCLKDGPPMAPVEVPSGLLLDDQDRLMLLAIGDHVPVLRTAVARAAAEDDALTAMIAVLDAAMDCGAVVTMSIRARGKTPSIEIVAKAPGRPAWLATDVDKLGTALTQAVDSLFSSGP